MQRRVKEKEATLNESPDSERLAYDASFWMAYLANTSLMVAISVLFRYADFVFYLGGAEFELGLIVGVGMVGALSMRIVQGIGIDRYGPRLVWLLSLSLFIVSTLGHLAITRVDGPAIYIARMVMTVGVAGAFGASLTYVSLRVPEVRIAEMIGMLGSSGFVGLALGPVLGDYLFLSGAAEVIEIQRMFLLSAFMATLSVFFAAWATRGEIRRAARRRLPMFWLVRRYHPGHLLLVAIAMGIGVGLPHVFLRAYTAELNIPGIRTFFLVYAVTAFGVRIATRRLTQTIGIHAVIVVGLACLSGSMLLYLIVTREALLAIPAVFAGIAHAFLFPAVVAGGSASFPSRYRGLATTLVLGMFDVGNLIGQPTVGGIVHLAKQWNMPAYPTMFVCIAAVLAAIDIFYLWAGRAKR